MRAVIYTRVSKDTARGRSVAEQEAECRRTCERSGWQIAEVLVDNDAGASRWSKDKRPSYDRLAEILKPGDVLVTWEASRAQRDLRAYVALRELCAERGVLWCYSGRTFDLSRSDDRFATLLDIGLAEKEVDQTRERVLRTLRANLEAGKPHGRNAYGYRVARDPDSGRTIGRELHPDEAPIVREVADRFLGGESLYSIARDLNERGVPPRQTNRWTGTALSKMLKKPVYAALRTHNDEVTGPGTWPTIVTEDEYHRLRAILTDPARKTSRGTKAVSLLSGIALCGVCGTPLLTKRHSQRRRPSYACTECHKVSRLVEVVDAEVLPWIEKLLNDERVRARVLQTDDTDAADVLAKIEAIRARWDEFAIEAADGNISARAFAQMESRWQAEIDALEAQLPTAEDPALRELVDGRTAWETMSLETQRGIVRSVLVVTVNPMTAEKPIDVHWRE